MWPKLTQYIHSTGVLQLYTRKLLHFDRNLSFKFGAQCGNEERYILPWGNFIRSIPALSPAFYLVHTRTGARPDLQPLPTQTKRIRSTTVPFYSASTPQSKHERTA